MAATFTALASGSAGNASLVRSGDFGLLIDFGLPARTIAGLLARRGFSWRHVNAVLLTHTHGDHWSRSALSAIMKHGLELWCHPAHAVALAHAAPREFEPLRQAGRVHAYAPDAWADLGPDVRALPRPVSHDAEPTFAFRLEGARGLFGPGWSVGFASDLGQWEAGLADLFAGVDLLAVEFNHDVRLQRSSPRPAHLIDRVLGPRGHLSNEQAAGLVRAVQERTTDGHLRHLVSLHRSRECNTPELADAAARDSLFDPATGYCPAEQQEPTPTLGLAPPRAARPVVKPRRSRPRPATPSIFRD
jgi:phosphoribosyl 1,2-cyclic phosphodiesterase